MSTSPGVSASRAPRERGDLFGARFELFADVLAVGLAVAAASLPLITFPAALSTACTLLRRRRAYGEPCTARRYFARLRRRMARPGEWGAGAVVLAFAGLVAADAGLAGAGLPGAAPFAVALALMAAAAAVTGLRACALRSSDVDTDAQGTGVARTDGPRAAAEHEPPGWRAAVRAGAVRTVRDLPGSGLVALALCTAAACAWALPLVLVLLPGPLALALTAVELRCEPDT
ncbi:hypothetical protein [Streptomyces winkii]|uniref:hypothetical protein n=1 Tax=Streptomyces winkii TaxID=3051178 RepID=UPI0028D13CE6|nr:hypothetical protein [Streptomyces sp. DSM 40971]